MIVRRKLPMTQIFIDANCINALQRDEDVNQLEVWDAHGVVSLRLPEEAQREVEAAGDKQRRKAMNRLVPCALITTDQEKETLKTIEDIISTKKPLSKNDASDALNVFIAWKYGSAILITADRALLQKAGALQSALAAQVMRPRQVVELVRKQIAARDRAARNEAQRCGSSLPDWVGQD